MGFTHHARYYGIPVYLGDIEFGENHPVAVIPKWEWMGPIFDFAAFIEWLFTPPNAKSMFMLGPEIKEGDE